MPLAPERTLLEVSKPSRWKLKRLAAKLERPMYRVLDDIIDAATQETDDGTSTDTARQAPSRLVLDRK